MADGATAAAGPGPGPAAPARGLVIAVVGAESTGKTTLAAALAAALASALRSQTGGRRVAWVPELLREWCERVGRTPQAQEQAAILRGQQERIEAAAETHDLVVADTTPLLTAVYSRLVFGDRSLERRAAELHARNALTLLTALDLPWVADGHQRDGAHMQAPVDAALRELLLRHRLPFAVVGGRGEQRLQQALAAVQPLLAAGQPLPAIRAGTRPADAAAGTGLFSRLAGTAPVGSRWQAWCECCSVPELERASRRG